MKVKKLVVEEGMLGIDGKKKLCPYQDAKAAYPCGTWCALFTVETPGQNITKVYLNCAQITYEG